MTLGEFIEGLNRLTTEYPVALNMEVVYCDDNDDTYHTILFPPSMCQFHDPESFNELVGYYIDDLDDISLEDCNAVCIN